MGNEKGLNLHLRGAVCPAMFSKSLVSLESSSVLPELQNLTSVRIQGGLQECVMCTVVYSANTEDLHQCSCIPSKSSV